MTFNNLIEQSPDAILMDGYDDCIIGVCNHQSIIVYDYEKVINKLMTNSEMSYDEAVEFHNYNQADCYLGENTPIFLKRIEQ